MMNNISPPFRAEHVGSLIRSPELLQARVAHAAGTLPAAALRECEDAAIREVVAMQERVGLSSISDGELRRNNWRDRFFERVSGFSKDRVESSFIFTDFSGERRRGVPVPVTVDTLKRREALTAEDFAFLKGVTKGTPKATLPSPTVNHFFSGDAGLKGSPYADRRAFFADVAAIYRQEVADLAAIGCTYLQIDEVPIAVLCDPRNHQIVRARGEDPQELVDDYIAAINGAVSGRPKDMTVCVHLCRGNSGHGQASGGYDPVAEQLFQQLDVDGYFLEYDTERAGDFRPLRLVPKDKTVVLGLISTKQRELEPIDDLKRRVAEAGRFVDMERLCLSPQCGFASSSLSNSAGFSRDDQERKLAHVVRAADDIWRS
jgi:5-methyltetrahydropteroyltriglutamate--homocysteine methyltransferase